MNYFHRLTDEQILHVFTEVTSGRGHHYGFVLGIADAVCQATHHDFMILRPIAVIVIAKYRLAEFLDTFDRSPLAPIEGASA